MHPMYLRLLASFIMLVSVFFGLRFSQEGFNHIQEFKQLERIVPTSILGSLNGAAQLQGLAYPLSHNAVLRSPKAGVESLYYRYLLEKQERDSDGDTSWVTKKDISKSVDFKIIDRSAAADVYSGSWVDEIQWSMSESYSSTQGDWRYSEWRIEPEDSVLIFAWADVVETKNMPPELSLRFDKPGNYLPIISKHSAEYVRAGLGNIAILKIWGGVSLLALSLLAFIYAAQIHRILVFLSFLAVVTAGILGSYGLATLSSDVRSGSIYLFEQTLKTERVARGILESRAMPPDSWAEFNEDTSTRWSELDDWQKIRFQDIRLNLVFLREVYLSQIGQFPENLYAWFFGLAEPNLVIHLTPREKTISSERLASFDRTKVTGHAFWLVLIGLFVFIATSWFGFRFAKVKRMIENVQTTATLGVSFGIAEVKGRVKLCDENSLKGPVSRQRCIWYRYLIEEHQKSGKNSRWVTISDDTDSSAFYCRDLEGELLVNPSGAEVHTQHKKVEREGSMRYSEWAIRPGDKLYAIGQAAINEQEGDQLVLSKGEDKDDIFILSNYSEKELMIKKAAKSMLALTLAFSAMFLASVSYRAMSGQFSATDYLLSGLLAPAFLMFFMIVLHYNDLIFLKKRAQRNWANIQVSLKKRSTLLKQLQAVVGQYQTHEGELLEKIVTLRKMLKHDFNSPSSLEPFLLSEHQLVQDLHVKVEDSPDLKANDLVTQFTETLTKLENEVALMRVGYNDAVNEYNIRVQSFPDLVLAKTFGFVEMERLNFDEEIANAVKL